MNRDHVVEWLKDQRALFLKHEEIFKQYDLKAQSLLWNCTTSMINDFACLLEQTFPIIEVEEIMNGFEQLGDEE